MTGLIAEHLGVGVMSRKGAPDRIALGESAEDASEEAHALTSDSSYALSYRLRVGRALIANEPLDGNRGLDFVDFDYALPAAIAGRATLRIRIEPVTG
ncbi:hypothetical protein FHY18_000509 [Xanthomonas arboricola]|nr:hypothetical protein [Xanthomonas sp. 3793]